MRYQECLAKIEDGNEYIYCQVKPITHKHKTFYYICEDENVKIGDFVDIPYSKSNEIRIAEVLDVIRCRAENAPENPKEVKKIQRVLTEDNSDYVRFINRNGKSHIINPMRNEEPSELAQIEYSIDSIQDVDLILSKLQHLDCLELEYKIKVLRSFDKYFVEWGSKNHKYRINPTVTKEEVEKFERAYEVKLPDEYVKFITEVGNGVMDIYELNVWNYSRLNNYLKYDFVLGDFGNLVEVESLAEQLGYDCCYDDDDDEFCENCVHRRFCPESYSVDDYDVISYGYLLGTLPLSYQGCTYMECLVVTGKKAGSVWIDNEGIAMSCIAESFDVYINNKVDNMLNLYIDCLTMMKNRCSAEEISKIVQKEHSMYNLELRLCGMLNIDISEEEQKNDSLLIDKINKKLENLYNN